MSPRPLAAASVLLLTTACRPPEGMERGPCSPEKTCNAGLTCLSEVCVAVPEDFCAQHQRPQPSPKAAPPGAPPPGAPAPGGRFDAVDLYRRRAMAVEALELLRRFRVGAKQYLQADHFDTSGRILPKRFPPAQTGWVPESPCCKHPAGKCPPVEELWRSSPWKELQIAMGHPHRFQVRYTGTGEGPQATATLEARADLDCNGKFSLYSVAVTIDGELDVVSKEPVIRDGLE